MNKFKIFNFAYIDERKDKKSTKRKGIFWNFLIYYKKGGLLKLEVQYS